MTHKSYITHIGTAVPTHTFTQQVLVEHFLQHGQLSEQANEKLAKIFTGTGIEKRHFVLNFNEDLKKYFSSSFSISERMQWYEQYASALGIQAVRNTGLSSEALASVTHLITISCTGMYAPGIDVDIIKDCGLPSTVARTCIYFMGCAAMVNGLKAADAICRSNPDARVLVVSVELCSLHFQAQSEEDAMVANALFADGAACVFLQGKPEPGRSIAISGFYSELLKDTKKHMAWSIRNEGFLITLSAFIPMLLSSGLKKLMSPLMSFYGLHLNDVDDFVIHPGGPKILKKIQQLLNIEPQRNAAAYEILKEYGNMSSVTIIFILQRLLKNMPKDKKDKNILGMAFGPGLTVESFLLKVCQE